MNAANDNEAMLIPEEYYRYLVTYVHTEFAPHLTIKEVYWRVAQTLKKARMPELEIWTMIEVAMERLGRLPKERQNELRAEYERLFVA
jgi:hypothetical protein